LVRAIDIDAPAEAVFRWLCQLKAAPYSYDWIDNLGRRSPQQLTPGLEQLEVGQAFLIGHIVEFVPNEHITAATSPRAGRLFGHIAISYTVALAGADASRLVVKLNVGAAGLIQRTRRFLLAWGDLVMMRKQLLNLKACAEGQHEEARRSIG
jgi:hypothetical protein